MSYEWTSSRETGLRGIHESYRYPDANLLHLTRTSTGTLSKCILPIVYDTIPAVKTITRSMCSVTSMSIASQDL